MGTLDQHQSSQFVKLLVLGDPSAGKTGALTSLVAAGYKFLIEDYDNKLNTLKQFVMKECPQNAPNVRYVTLQDKFKAANGTIVKDGVPTAFSRGIKLMDNWSKANGADEDIGKPGTLGAEWIFVIDTLTFLSDSCYDYFDAMNPGCKDKRQIYGLAQEALADMFDLLMSKDFKCHVIVNAHINYQDNHLGIQKGFARTIGQALNSRVASWFNGAILVESTGTGNNIKRQVRLPSNGIIELSNPAPFKLTQETLPISTALADYFKAVLS